MNLKQLIILLSLSCLFFSCGEQEADIVGAKNYAKDQISFQYPGNWTISNDTEVEDFHNLFVETTGEGIVIIQMYPVDSAQDQEQYAKDFSQSTMGSMPIGKITNSKFLPIEEPSTNELIETFDIELFNERIPHKRRYIMKTFDDHRCYLIFQISSEDEAKALKGFELIHSSFELKPSVKPDPK